MSSPHASLLPPHYKDDIRNWLNQDAPTFDYGGYVVGEKIEYAMLYGKTPGVLAGVPFFDEVFRQLNCRIEWLMFEGESFEPVMEVARMHGRACDLLLGERTALNIIARCSGVATRARRCVDLAKHHGFKGVIAGTRKVTPGFRLVEKYGMLVGGADTHRMDLSSMVMLKDNHIWSQGSITQAIARARSVGGFALRIEVECQNEAEADEAIQAGADIVMLDNLKGEELKEAARALKERWAGQRAFLIESSGGVTEYNVANFFSPHIDIISMGSLSQGVPHVDFSLKIQKRE